MKLIVLQGLQIIEHQDRLLLLGKTRFDFNYFQAGFLRMNTTLESQRSLMNQKDSFPSLLLNTFAYLPA